MNNKPRWYLIHTKPRQETTARDNLEKQGHTIYLPQISQRCRSRNTISPLFPRYLFIRLVSGQDDWGPIRSTRGVSSIVRVGLTPATISDQLVEAIRQRADADGLHRLPGQSFKKGDRVRLISGPFADYEAIFGEQRAENRAIILLGLIGKQSPIEVSTENIATL